SRSWRVRVEIPVRARTPRNTVRPLLRSPVVRRALLDERVQAFLAIVGSRNERKTFRGIFDRAAEIGIDRAHEGIAADLHDHGRLGGQPSRDLSGAIKRAALGYDLAEQAHAVRR